MRGGVYEPRVADATVLYHVVRQHLEPFLAAAAAATEGVGVPRFVEAEFRAFLGCGLLTRGFARVRCDGCAFERLIPFSCKGRFCPSCCGRRMAAQAAQLVDRVLPAVPVRQWVLTVPHRLRYRLAFDHALARAVLRVFVRALLALYRRRARRAGVADGHSGTVTVIQRFGSGLELNVHLHTLALDGAFWRAPDGTLRFQALPAPTDAEVARLVASVARRVGKLLARRGLGDGEAAGEDALAVESAALAGLANAAVQGRLALGPRAGTRVERLGHEAEVRADGSSPPLQARHEGFDLHAAVTVGADDRARLEQLARYVLRPPIAQERLGLDVDGRVVVALKRPWRDGTTHVRFEPLGLLERLAVLTPRPRVNTVLYHGVLAPRAAWRAAVVAYGRTEPAAPASVLAGLGATPRAPVEPASPGPLAAAATPAVDGAPARPAPAPPRPEPDRDRREPDLQDAGAGEAAPRASAWRWADLMRRVFALDVLACPRCGGRMRVVATIDDPAVIRKILAHLEMPLDEPPLAPAPRDWPGG